MADFSIHAARASRFLTAMPILIRSAGLHLLNWLIPPTCPVCHAETSMTGPDGLSGLLCASCFATLNFIVPPVCQCCGRPMDAAEGIAPDGVCEVCRIKPPRFRHARAALLYDDGSRRIILPFKHADRMAHASLLARWMADSGGDLLRQADWLVPVPLHPSRLRQRRYNQSALLCRALSRLTGVPVMLDGLQRIRRTPSLGTLTARQRQQMMRGAIQTRAARRQKLRATRIVVVDDVMTSGATISACVRALYAAGAASVDVLTAARVELPDEIPLSGQVKTPM
ncbi:Amidophosphoribosyltransferase family protein [Granulibacter bethesdensis]|nr:Amidophosphoribosyltransferase family protein [Granulibacter bethesdensis]